MTFDYCALEVVLLTYVLIYTDRMSFQMRVSKLRALTSSPNGRHLFYYNPKEESLYYAMFMPTLQYLYKNTIPV